MKLFGTTNISCRHQNVLDELGLLSWVLTDPLMSPRGRVSVHATMLSPQMHEEEITETLVEMKVLLPPTPSGSLI